MREKSSGDGTVGKALSVLDMVAAFGQPVKFNQLLEQSPFPKATLYRLLQTLVHQNILAFDTDQGTYQVGLRVVRLAHAAWKSSSLAPLARPFVDALAQQTGDIVHLAQFDAGQVLYIDKRKADDRFETLAQVGNVAPAYCTGVGKAMLAFLPPHQLQAALQQQAFHAFTPATLQSIDALLQELSTIKAEGVAYDREEHEVGTISIAAPIFGYDQRLLGAISVATSTARKSLEELTAHKAELLKTATLIGDAAAAWHAPV